MTLFKKVFQAQATAVPEDNLRMSPHATGDQALPQEEHHASGADAFSFTTDADGFDDGSEAENSSQDADIAAILKQTKSQHSADLADTAPDIQEPQVGEDHPPTVDQNVSPNEGPSDSDAQSEPEASVPQNPTQTPQSDTQRSADEAAALDEPSRDEDLVAFAQQQMRAASFASEPQPDAPAEPESQNEPDQPTVDLSQIQTLPPAMAPSTAPAARRPGRVKTRLLGFNRAAEEDVDPFDTAQQETASKTQGKFPVGWLVVVDGPGRGYSFALFSGASMIGRGDDQVIRLDFGDNAISRQNHAAIAYDDEQNKFYLGHGGKSNIIRLNARPVLTTEEIKHADLIRIGETTLRFVALCGSDFQWIQTGEQNDTAL